MNSYKILVFLVILFFFDGCAVKKVKQPPIHKPPTVSKEEVPQAILPAPQEETRIPLTINLVMGGGGVASFATVGILKKLDEEKIPINSIIVTGWPALFATIYCLTGSSYDTEWFAMKLKEEDFFNKGLLSAFKNDFSSVDHIGQLVSDVIKKSDLRQSKVPIVLMHTNTATWKIEGAARGHWLEPLLKSMSVPGIHGPYPKETYFSGISSINGLDVSYALSSGKEWIVSIDMYEEFIENEIKDKLKSRNDLFKRIAFISLRKNISLESIKSHMSLKVTINRPPFDFSAKRLAIMAGYNEASKIIQELQKNSIN